MNKIDKTNIQNNLLGQEDYRAFIEVQAVYGFAQRGGTSFINVNYDHQKRLVSNVNLLTENERRKVIFSETLFNN